jgi:hypothetical protein
MATSTVPISEEFGLEADNDTEVFCHSIKKISCHPKLISDLNSSAGSNLELPLTWHNFGIGS